MEEELQELREMVAQLRADNERLRQKCVLVLPSSRDARPNMPGPSAATSQSSSEYAALPEIFVFVPRDRKCPKFSGRVGIDIDEWV